VSSLVTQLAGRLAGDVHDDVVTRSMYATDASIYRAMPVAVAHPRNAEDVAAIVDWSRANGVPLHGRGSGSGLTGACLGTGLVVDFRRYMHALVEIRPDDRTVRVQPGVVHTDLNRALARYGLFFPPDPASGDYCSLGGMLANNSSGARSVKYGATIDYVRSLEAVVPSAGPVTLGTAGTAALEGIRCGLSALLDEGLDTFRARLPRAPKNCCGYRLERVRRDDGTLDLAALLVGSEGTLGLVTEATLAVLPLPKVRRLALANFGSLEAMSEAVVALLPLRPSAIEVMDKPFLDLVRTTRADLRDYIPEGTQAQLLIEVDGSHDEAAAGIARLRDILGGPRSPATMYLEARDEADQEKLWAVRRAALPLLFTLPGPGRITPFIEDVSVAPELLGTYLSRLHAIFDRHGLQSAVYGHAGDGNLHTRPILDLRQQSDVDLMQRLADEVFAVTLELGGSISGEHGDGRVRTPFLPAFYREAYGLLEATKRLFDPEGLLNPGIIAGAAGSSMTANLRQGPEYRRRPVLPPLGGTTPEFAETVERCHGCGKCTTPSDVVAMCPLYKATGRPEASPRGKMTLAQSVLAGRLDLDYDTIRMLLDHLSYCLGCGLCHTECPSEVDTPQVVRQLRAFLYQRTGIPLGDRVVSLLSTPLPRLLQPFAWFASRVGRLHAARLLLQAVVGISRRTPLFEFSPFGLPSVDEPGAPRAVYVPDTYAALCEPDLGALCLDLLHRAGFVVRTDAALAACTPALARGDAQTAREAARTLASLVVPYLAPRVPLVFSEPTALLTVTEDYPRLLDDETAARTMTSAAVDLLEVLLERLADGAMAPPPDGPRMPEQRIVYHRPCHLRGSRNERTALTLLQRLGYQVDLLPTTCCGMAGTFGLKAGEPGYDTGQQVGAPVFAAIRERQTTLVVSECSACRLQISAATGVRAVHPAVLVAACYVGSESEK